MEVKFKRLSSDAVIPSYANEGDAGLDITCTGYTIDESNGTIVYTTGISIEIPEGYVGLLFPRSSISNYDLALANSVGVIDCTFRGNILLKFKPNSNCRTIYKNGDKVGQLIIIPYPKITLKEVDELSDTTRGSKGFGSSGK